jgi:hypothetical protein
MFASNAVTALAMVPTAAQTIGKTSDTIPLTEHKIGSTAGKLDGSEMMQESW